MPDRDTPPFRADHVGSLLRPQNLADARAKWRDGKLDGAELKAIEDEAIRGAVALQESVGLKGVTDGEFRRDYWHLDFMLGFEGIEPSEKKHALEFSDGQVFEAVTPKNVGKIAYPANGIMREHFKFLAGATTALPKFTIPAPVTFRTTAGRHVQQAEVYGDRDEFLDDIGAAYADAVRDFAAMGCRYLQIDDVNTTILCDTRVQERITGEGTTIEQYLERNIAMNNAAARARPEGMTMTVHMCRGNFQSAYFGVGGYEVVAERYLSELDVDGFFMEYDTDRAGDFKPLRFLPKGKMVVLGIMTSKSPELESKDELKRRVDEAAQYAPIEQLCISPQCGFASTHHGNKLTEDEEKRKLARLIETAEEVWGGI